MISRLALALTVMLVTMMGCTTIPARFTQDSTISESGGYRTEEETSHGFTLEVFYKAYSFFPNPDPAIQEARSYFVRTALEIAKRKGRTIRPFSTPDLHASATRNILDGHYAVYITGKVVYATE
jgi:hypothetical protein